MAFRKILVPIGGGDATFRWSGCQSWPSFETLVRQPFGVHGGF